MGEHARILCVINSLEGGGAERVFVAVADALARAYGREAVEVLLLDDAPARYAAPPGVRVSVLGADGAMGASVRGVIAHAMRTQPQVILSFLNRASCAAITAAWRTGARVAISQRVQASAFFGAAPAQIANRVIMRALYPHADRVLAVSQGVAKDLALNFGIRRERLAVIYNPLDIDGVRQAARAPLKLRLPQHFFVAVGRLIAKKNVRMLLRAYARARHSTELVILGEGPQRAELEAFAHALGIARHVHFLGFAANPHAIMARARAFVSTSNSEGFPNALVEALALGLPAAFTDCESGPAEILGRAGEAVVTRMTEAQHGLLVPPDDDAQMAAALQALESAELRARLSKAALARSEDFAAHVACAAYVAEIDRLLPAPLRLQAKESADAAAVA